MHRRARIWCSGVRSLLWVSCLLGVAACAPWNRSRIETVERISLPTDSYTSLYVDAQERLWLGRQGELLVMDPAGKSRRLATEGQGVPTVVGELAGRVVVRSDARLLAIDPLDARVRAGQDLMSDGLLLPDARERVIFQLGPAGSVLLYDAHSLEPVWGWAARGAAGTALATSPEGDRVYQALVEGDSSAMLLTRDLQTGRVLDRTPISGRIRLLVRGASGALLGVVEQAGSSVLHAWQPQSGLLVPHWSYVADELGRTGELMVRSSPEVERVLLFRPESETGLRVINAETGELLGAGERAPLDARFANDGIRLYLLYPGEVQIARCRC